MASDSDDVDEFFDAQDATPFPQSSALESFGHQRLATLEQNLLTETLRYRVSESRPSGGEYRLEIDRLQSSSLIEKNLLDEEEELRRRLDEIERKKQEQAEKQVIERRATENRERRQKLEAMRQAVEQGVPTSGVNADFRRQPQHAGVAVHQSAESSEAGRRTSGGVDMQVGREKYLEGLDDTMRHRSGSSSKIETSRLSVEGMEGRRDLRQCNSAEDLARLNTLPSGDRSPGLRLSNGSTASNSLPHQSNGRNLSQAATTSDRPFTQNDRTPVRSDDIEVDGDEEPDIVRSTKERGGSLGRGQPPIGSGPTPVAPPRRRKQRGNAEAEVDAVISMAGEVAASAAMSAGEVAAGAFAPSTGTLASEDNEDVMSDEGDLREVANLMSELERTFSLPGAVEGVEPVLDISSATKGHRVVTVIEDILLRSPFSLNDEAFADSPSDSATCPSIVAGAVGGNEAGSGGETLQKAGEDFDEEMVTVSVARKDRNGDEYMVPLTVNRPRSPTSNRYLTDKEIHDGQFVTNLDTGESLPLDSAEEKLPQCINPLALHIMRRTKEYSESNGHKMETRSEDELSHDTVCIPKSNKPPGAKKKTKFRKLLGKTVHKIRTKADEVFHGDESGASDDDDVLEGRRTLRMKASHTHKGPFDFDLLVLVQELFCPKAGPVWTMKFSHCGRLLATGGQDCLLRVWVLRDAFNYFNEMRQKFNDGGSRISPAASNDSLSSQSETASENRSNPGGEGLKVGGEAGVESAGTSENEAELEHVPFKKKPFCIYTGHTADLLDISWSKNYFLLSSSMDKTVRLWHVSRQECLCCFQHIDFVTAIAFHPKDDRYFLSGSLDGKLRLWNIPDKKVALWNEVTGSTKLITAANFCLGGRFAVVGTYDGRCVFYSTEQLKYYTQIHVRSTRGRNARGRKITGVEPFPGEDKILVTSNDSRIRLYDLRDLTLTCKYKGCTNNSSQIKASFSNDGKYITCGSEDQFVYIWKTMHDLYKFSSARKDRNDYWESVKAHNAVVTNAIFAPCPELIIKAQFDFVDPDDKDNTSGARGEVLVSADYTGAIKVFLNKFKPAS